jgi:hypothetical protein
MATLILLEPAQAGSRGNRSSFSAAPHFSGSTVHFAGPSRSFSSGAARHYSPVRFSSGATFRNRSWAGSGHRFVARQSGNWNRHWDRGHDHFWHGHRCRWINNSWVIFATAFYPYGYGYGYYPYGPNSYYDGGYYDDSYAANEYAPAQSDYDSGEADSSVSEVQSALSREGYYSGSVDGSLGRATQIALRKYQRDRGLRVTGRIDRAVVDALGLR